MNDRDYELISAYIDDVLTGPERAILESRLQAEPDLQQALDSLRQTVALLRQMPDLKAPRNFTLTTGMIGSQSAAGTVIPFAFSATFSALSAAAAVLLFVFGGYFLLNTGAMSLTTAPNFQQVSEQPAAVAIVSTATLAATPSPMATMLPPAPGLGAVSVPEQAQAAAQTAPPATLTRAAPSDESADDQTDMFAYEADGEGQFAQEAESGALDIGRDEAENAALDTLMQESGGGAAPDESTAMMMMATDVPPLVPATAVLLPASTIAPELRLQPTAMAEGRTAMPQTEVAMQDAVSRTVDAESAEIDAAGTLPEERQRATSAFDTGVLGLVMLIISGLLLLLAVGTTLIRRQRLNA